MSSIDRCGWRRSRDSKIVDEPTPKAATEQHQVRGNGRHSLTTHMSAIARRCLTVSILVIVGRSASFIRLGAHGNADSDVATLRATFSRCCFKVGQDER